MVWDQERAGRIQEALAESGFAALVCRLPENVLLLTGYWPMNGMSWVVAAQGHEPFVIVPKGEE